MRVRSAAASKLTNDASERRGALRSLTPGSFVDFAFDFSGRFGTGDFPDDSLRDLEFVWVFGRGMLISSYPEFAGRVLSFRRVE